MKKIFTLAVVAMCATALFAQDKIMKVWMSSAPATEIPVSMIDSITFEEVTGSYASPDFLMYVEDIFTITGRGTVLTGTVVKGDIDSGAVVRAIPIDPSVLTVEYPTIVAIEAFKKLMPSATAGDTVGLLLGDVDKTGFPRGTALVAKTSIYKPTKKITVDMHVNTKEEGGRHTPFFKGYKPQLYIGTTDVTVELTNIGEGGTIEDGCMPGDDITGAEFTVAVEGYQIVPYLGQEVNIREAGKTVATATITSIE